MCTATKNQIWLIQEITSDMIGLFLFGPQDVCGVTHTLAKELFITGECYRHKGYKQESFWLL